MSSDSPAPNATLVPWIMWASFVVTHLMFVGIGQLVPTPESALPPEQLEITLYALGGVGLGVLAFSLLVAPRMFARTPYLSFMILRFALAESLSIFGLVLAMQGADWRVPVTFTAFGLLLHVLAAPTDADRRRHEQAMP